MMEQYTLYRGDCLRVMPTLEAGSIDLTVTSPPYDNLREYGADFDADRFDWKGIIAELYRVTKPGGVVVWVVADATVNGSETGTSFRQALWAMECGFNLHDTMIYQKDAPQFPDANRYANIFEFMFVFSKNKPSTYNPIQDRINKSFGRKVTGTDRNADGSTRLASCWGQDIYRLGIRFNCWQINTSKGNESTGHPAQFPESLAHDHILSWSNPGDTVCDPMMGSGTTGKIAMLTERRFIGIELDAGYFTVAEHRIADAARQARGEFRTIQDARSHDDLPLFAST